MAFIIILVLALGIWMLYGYLSIRTVEKPNYTVITPQNGVISTISHIEIRTYSNMIIAETVVNEPYSDAINTGFRIIANYIFGNNTASTAIAMTSPVLQAPAAQTIAMTTPVLQTQNENKSYTISFVMPSKYTMESIPKPNSAKVQLREIKSRTIAVISFSGIWTDAKAEIYRTILENALTKDIYTFDPTPQFARYNPPWTPPWMRRNEIWFVLHDEKN